MRDEYKFDYKQAKPNRFAGAAIRSDLLLLKWMVGLVLGLLVTLLLKVFGA